MAALAAQMMAEDQDFRSQVMGNVAMQRAPIDVEPLPPAIGEQPSWEDSNEQD